MTDQYLARTAFAVNVETNALVRRRLVSGPIWLEINGESFPGRGWEEFPVVILGFWLTNLQPVVFDKSHRCGCPFMDGPYRFDIDVVEPKQWAVTFVDREANKEKILLTAKVDSDVVLNSIVSSAEAVVSVCRRKQWFDDDLSNLEGLIRDTKAILSR